MDSSLKELISERFKSQADCARALKWPRQKLHRITSGETMPTLADTEALSAVLALPIETVSQKILTNKSRK